MRQYVNEHQVALLSHTGRRAEEHIFIVLHQKEFNDIKT